MGGTSTRNVEIGLYVIDKDSGERKFVSLANAVGLVTKETEKLNNAQQKGASSAKQYADSQTKAGDALNHFQRHAQISAESVTNFGGMVKMVTKELSTFSFQMWILASNTTLWTTILGGAAMGINKFVQEGGKLADVRHGFEEMAAGQHVFSQEILEKTRPAVRGLINDLDIMKSYNTAVALRVRMNADDFSVLSGAAVKMSRVMGIDVTHALDSLITGLGRQSIRVLDNIGIIMKAKEAYELYAHQHNKLATALTDSEKRLAFQQMAIMRLRENMNKAGESVATLAESFNQAKVIMENVVQQTMAYVVTNTFAMQAGTSFKDAIQALSDKIWASRDSIVAFIASSVDFYTSITNGIAAITGFIAKWGGLIAVATKVMIFAELAAIFGKVGIALKGIYMSGLMEQAIAMNIKMTETAVVEATAMNAAIGPQIIRLKTIGLSNESLRFGTKVAIERATAEGVYTAAVSANSAAIAANNTFMATSTAAWASLKQSFSTFVASIGPGMAQAAAAVKAFATSVQGAVIIGYALGTAFAWAFDQMNKMDAKNTTAELKKWGTETETFGEKLHRAFATQDYLAIFSEGLTDYSRNTIKAIDKISERTGLYYKDLWAAKNMETRITTEVLAVYASEHKTTVDKLKAEDIAYVDANRLQLARQYSNESEFLHKWLSEYMSTKKSIFTVESAQNMFALPGFKPKAVEPEEDPAKPKRTAEQILGIDIVKFGEINVAFHALLAKYKEGTAGWYETTKRYADLVRAEYKKFNPTDLLSDVRTFEEMAKDLISKGMDIKSMPKGYEDTTVKNAAIKMYFPDYAEIQKASILFKTAMQEAQGNILNEISVSDKYADKIRTMYKDWFPNDATANIKNVDVLIGKLNERLVGAGITLQKISDIMPEFWDNFASKNRQIMLEKQGDAWIAFGAKLSELSQKMKNLEFMPKGQGPAESVGQNWLDRITDIKQTIDQMRTDKGLGSDAVTPEMQPFIDRLEAARAKYAEFKDYLDSNPIEANFVMGLTNGFKSMQETILETANALGGDILNGFTNFFESVLSGSKSVGEAFKDLGKSILSSIVRSLSQILAQWLMTHLVMMMSSRAKTTMIMANEASEASASVAASGVKSAANTAEAGTSIFASAANFFKAHSWIPWVGAALAIGFIALMMSTLGGLKGGGDSGGGSAVAPTAGIHWTNSGEVTGGPHNLGGGAPGHMMGLWEVPGGRTDPYPMYAHGKEMVVQAPEAEKIRDFTRKATEERGSNLNVAPTINIGNGDAPIFFDNPAQAEKLGRFVADTVRREVERAMRSGTAVSDPYGING